MLSFTIRFSLCWIGLFFVHTMSLARPYYDFSPKARQAYEYTLALRFKEAEDLLTQLKKETPENLIIDFVENYIDFFTVMVDEDQGFFKQRQVMKSVRLQKLSQGDPSSPYHLYIQAELQLQWALMRSKFGEYLTAFRELSKANTLLQKNQKLFPDFIANQKTMGILQAMVGSIPDNYQWGASWLSGIDASVSAGRLKIEKVLQYAANHDFIFEKETLVTYGFLLLHLENQEAEAWSLLKSSQLNPKENPMAAFVLANVAMKTGHNDEAISILVNRPQDAAFHAFPYLEGLLGFAKVNRLDADADQFLLRFVRQYKGQNYLKEAYQKLAWHALLVKSDEAGYQSYLKLCRSQGAAKIGNDKSALKEAQAQKPPNRSLLKARVLFDGGYYLAAEKAILTLDPQKSSLPVQLEYFYRYGRILQKKEAYAKAIGNFNQAIFIAKGTSSYFACNGALQVGSLYEKLKDSPKARQYYQLCLSLPSDDHETSIHQKAKMGLNRLK